MKQLDRSTLQHSSERFKIHPIHNSASCADGVILQSIKKLTCINLPKPSFGKHHHGHNLKAPQLTETDKYTLSHTLKTHGFLFSSQRISKSLNLCCDNYPCSSPMEHLHNHHQPFTEDTQRIIMRQQRNKEHSREPLKTQAAVVA